MFWPQAASREQRAERRKRRFSPKPFLHFFWQAVTQGFRQLIPLGADLEGHEGPRSARFDAQGRWILTRAQGAARGPKTPPLRSKKNAQDGPPKKNISKKKVSRWPDAGDPCFASDSDAPIRIHRPCAVARALTEMYWRFSLQRGTYFGRRGPWGGLLGGGPTTERHDEEI